MISIKNAMYMGMAVVLLSACAQTVEKKTDTAFFPPLPQQPRLQYLVSITSEEDIGAKQSSAVQEWLIGKRPSAKQIVRPHDIGASPGKIYVLDKTLNKVLILDLAKKEFDFIRDEREGALGDPVGLWITQDEVKYVADKARKQIVVFDRDNKFVKAYGDPEQFESPLDVAVYQNRIYVVDFGKMAVVVLDKETGKTLQMWGEFGTEVGKFNRPTHVNVDQQGNVYVNDAFNFRIQKFDPNGKYLKHFGYLGDNLGGFARPKDFDIDREGYLYAVDAAFENTQIFDPESTNLLLFFGGYGPHAGSMYLPSGLHIDYDNLSYFSQYVDKDFRLKYLVYVANSIGDKKINVYGFGDWIGPPLPVIQRAPASTQSDSNKEKDAAGK